MAGLTIFPNKPVPVDLCAFSGVSYTGWEPLDLAVQPVLHFDFVDSPMVIGGPGTGSITSLGTSGITMTGGIYDLTDSEFCGQSLPNHARLDGDPSGIGDDGDTTMYYGGAYLSARTANKQEIAIAHGSRSGSHGPRMLMFSHQGSSQGAGFAGAEHRPLFGSRAQALSPVEPATGDFVIIVGEFINNPGGVRSWVNGSGPYVAPFARSPLETQQDTTTLRLAASAHDTSNGPGNARCIATGVLKYAASEAERQNIEGFLAWKAGRADVLPAGHPFKNSPP